MPTMLERCQQQTFTSRRDSLLLRLLSLPGLRREEYRESIGEALLTIMNQIKMEQIETVIYD